MNTLQRNVAQSVYRELSEVKDWWVIERVEKNGVTYLRGRPTKLSEAQVVLPLHCKTTLNWNTLKGYLRDGSHNGKLSLAVHDSDSSLVMYEAVAGLVAPAKIETSISSGEGLGTEFQPVVDIAE